jgi:hypothetical protein
MHRLLLRFVIFLVPPVLALALPAWVLHTSGELEPGEVFLQMRRESRPFLFGPAYSDSMGHLKLKAVQVEAPEVVALGSSRVAIFRQDFFAARFFNAGSGWYHQFDDLLAYLRRIPAGREPKLLIVGLDQKFFNTRWTSRIANPFDPPPIRTRERHWWSMLRAHWPDVYKDYFAGKFSIADLTRTHADGVQRVGLRAIARNSGHHEDGSYTWDWWESHAGDLRKIANGDDVYVYGSGVSPETISELETFLSECQRRGIYVAGFLPPFSPPVYHALEQDRRHYGYMFELADRLSPLFKRFQFSFADFTNPARCEIQREGFYDGQHASTPGYRRLWTCWTEADTRLKLFLSPDLTVRRQSVTDLRGPGSLTLSAAP